MPRARPFVFAACCVGVFYGVMLHYRGFGWDGDSFVNAAQFVRLVTPRLHEYSHLDTHPKLGMILLFGLAYRLTGSFDLTTLLCIALNAAAVGLLCRWVMRARGCWLLTLALMLMGRWWHPIVINADNPGFSVPLLFMGLAFYFAERQKWVGLACLALSSLFRPGAEFVVAGIAAIELCRGNRRIWPHALVLAVLLPLTSFSYLLGFPDKASFLRECVYHMPERPTPYAWRVVAAYLSQLARTPALHPTLVILLAAAGAVRCVRRRSTALAVLLAPLASLALGVGAFVYGVTYNIHFAKTMELYLMFSFFAGCAVPPLHVVVRRLTPSLRLGLAWTLVAVVAAAGVWRARDLGLRDAGEYEAHPNGTGELQWRSLRDVAELIGEQFPHGCGRALVDRKNQVFFFLDAGSRVAGVDLLRRKESLRDVDMSRYDVIVVNVDARRPGAHMLGGDAGDFQVIVAEGRLVAIRKRKPERTRGALNEPDA